MHRTTSRSGGLGPVDVALTAEAQAEDEGLHALAAAHGVRVERTRMPAGAPALVVGGVLLWSGGALRDALVALAGEVLARRGPFGLEQVTTLASEMEAGFQVRDDNRSAPT